MDIWDSSLSSSAKIMPVASVVVEKNASKKCYEQRSSGCEVLMVSRLWVYHTSVEHILLIELNGFCLEWINELSTDQNLKHQNFAILKQKTLICSPEYVHSHSMKITWDLQFLKMLCSKFCIILQYSILHHSTILGPLGMVYQAKFGIRHADVHMIKQLLLNTGL